MATPPPSNGELHDRLNAAFKELDSAKEEFAKVGSPAALITAKERLLAAKAALNDAIQDFADRFRFGFERQQ